MADEDKEKAEKLAAAKKRFEQLKKEQQKKGKKGGKKKEDKSAEPKVDEGTSEAAAPEETQEATDDAPNANEDNADAVDADQPESTKEASPPQPSRQRSESFRPGTDGAQAEVQDLYRKQAAKIEQLEKENRTLKEEQEQGATRLSKAEEELESLREGSSDLAELKTKAKETERLTAELAAVQRQLAQAQQAAAASSSSPKSGASAHGRRVSGTSNDRDAQLASQTSTIESLELEISSLRHQITGLENQAREHATTAQTLTERAETAESGATTAQQELDALKASLASPPAADAAAAEPAVALTQRISVLESDLRSAHASLDAAAQRATSLEQKFAALTTLHRDVTATAASKDKELAELRAAQRRRDRPSHVRDASEFELGEGEGDSSAEETGALQARIRALEAENFELKRGVWRERRAELQPGMDDGEAGGGDGVGYEDVDLDTPYSPRLGRVASGRQTSTLQDVITSGINAFTNRPQAQSRSFGAGPGQHERKPSLGLMSDDGFDEDAFRLAQEEDVKRRIERVKEVKRGLEQWKGWRVDIAEQRQHGIGGGRESGPVFEV